MMRASSDQSISGMARLCSSTRGSKGLLEDGAGELFARALTWFVGEG